MLTAARVLGSCALLPSPQEYADGGDLLQLLMNHGTRLSERRATSLVLQPLLRAVRAHAPTRSSLSSHPRTFCLPASGPVDAV